jgi:hypothetical protein
VVEVLWRWESQWINESGEDEITACVSMNALEVSMCICVARLAASEWWKGSCDLNASTYRVV